MLADAEAIFGRIVAADRQALEEAILAATRDMAMLEFEFRISNPERGVRWLITRATPEREADGGLLWRGYTTDVTEHHRVRSAMAETSTRLEGLITRLPVGIYVLASNRRGEDRFIYTSPRFLEMFELDPAFLARRAAPMLERIHPDDLEGFLAENNRAHETKTVFKWEGRGVIRGWVRWFYMESVPRPADGHGEVLWDGVTFDVTDRHIMEEELRQAQRAATAANLAKSEFLSTMSHELRTPLNAILGFAQLLEADRREPLSARQQDYLATILRAGGVLLALVDDVLDLARVESGQIRLSLESVDPAELVEDCIETLAPQWRARGVNVSFATDDRPPRVTADRRRLAQCVMNLLSNAIKYNRAGGHVVARVALPGDGCLVISVEDDGIGVPQDGRHLLFQPFHRLGREVSDIEGTGIGLKLSRDLMRAMGGDLRFHPREGGGSIFEMTLAVGTAEGPALDGRGDSHALITAARGARVLVVEDNRLNQALMHRIGADLALGPMTVVADAAGALARIEEALAGDGLPDLMILDLGLPDMTGLDLLAAMDRRLGRLRPPAIAVSADVHGTRREEALAAGFVAFVAKPIDLGRLAEALEVAAAGAPRRRRGRARR